MKMMFHHKKSNGGIDFVGFDTEKRVYSTDYYANVGLLNAGESRHTTLREVRTLTKKCAQDGFRLVTYLKA